MSAKSIKNLNSKKQTQHLIWLKAIKLSQDKINQEIRRAE